MTLDLDITYIIVLALFLMPVVILNGLVFRPFLKIFEERHEQLEGAIERAERMLAESEDEAQYRGPCSHEREECRVAGGVGGDFQDPASVPEDGRHHQERDAQRAVREELRGEPDEMAKRFGQEQSDGENRDPQEDPPPETGLIVPARFFRTVGVNADGDVPA